MSTHPSGHIPGQTRVSGDTPDVTGVDGPQTDRTEQEISAAEFERELRSDVKALQMVVDTDKLERLAEGRLGQEHEFCLVDSRTKRPKHVNTQVVETLMAAEATEEGRKLHDIEMGQAQVEERDAVRVLSGSVFSEQEAACKLEFQKLREAAALEGALVLPTGTMFTASQDDLVLPNMTHAKRDRYHRANAHAKLVREVESWDIEVGDVRYNMDNIMTVAQLCSSQPHLQVSAEHAVAAFNAAHAMAGLILAPCVGSPFVLRQGFEEGNLAHKESRIRLFEQAWDPERVTFSAGYISSIMDPFTRLLDLPPVFLERHDRDENPNAPSLPYLRLQNGSDHRWIRAIYDVYQGVPHVRTEFRFLPVVPDPLSNIANNAWAIGVTLGAMNRFSELGDGKQLETFFSVDAAKNNFYRAAEHGMDTLFSFPGKDGVFRFADIRVELADMAREGLRSVGIDQNDIDRYIGAIERRMGFARVGDEILTFQTMTEADWMLQTMRASLEDGLSKDDALSRLVDKIHQASVHNIPCTDREITA